MSQLLNGMNIKYFRHLKDFSDFTALQTDHAQHCLIFLCFPYFLFDETILMPNSALQKKRKETRKKAIFFALLWKAECHFWSDLKKSENITLRSLSSAGAKWAEGKCYRKPLKIQGSCLCKKLHPETMRFISSYLTDVQGLVSGNPRHANSVPQPQLIVTRLQPQIFFWRLDLLSFTFMLRWPESVAVN